jgi:hypothetical protein
VESGWGFPKISWKDLGEKESSYINWNQVGSSPKYLGKIWESRNPTTLIGWIRQLAWIALKISD